MKKQIFIMLFLGLAAISSSGQEKHHRVKVSADAEGIRLMAAKGIAVDHGVIEKGTYFISDFSDAELTAIRSLGLPYEVQIEDVANYYVERNKEDLAGKPRGEEGCLNCADHATPENFALGSVSGFYTYQEMLDILDSMRVKYPGLISAKSPISSTQSIEGRPIYYVRISNDPDVDQTDKPEVLYTALHHAREVQSLSQLIFYMWYLLENYGSNAEVDHLLNNRELYFVPCVNPDGYIHNQTTNPNGGGMWRKNRRDNGGTFGVDLNRNYASFWGFDNIGSSPNGSTETYRGTAAFSENETQAIRDFCNGREFKLALNAHTFSNLLIYPYSHIPDLLTADSNAFHCLADEMAACSGFITGTANQTVGYNTNGDSDGWMYDEQSTKGKIFALTPEAGSVSDGFWPMQSRIIPIAKNTMQQNLYAAWLAGAHAEVLPKLMPGFASLNAFVPFEFRRTGLAGGIYEVALVPVSANIASVGAPLQFTDPDIDVPVTDSIAIQFVAGISAGEPVRFALKWTHQSGDTWTDTFTSHFSESEVVFYSDGNSLDQFSGTGWGICNTHYTSPNGSISESPNNATYGNNVNKSLTTQDWIDLRNAGQAVLMFDARWDIEKGYDYAVVQAQEESGTWTTLCGLYTSKGSGFQGDQQVFDGNSKGWRQERMDLSAFAGKRIKLRFMFRSDGAVVSDGISFDEIKVIAGANEGTSISKRENIPANLSNSPNPCQDRTLVHYKISAGAGDAKLVVNDISGRVVRSTAIDARASNYTLDVSNFQEGIYFYHIESQGQRSATKKMIVIR